MLAADSNDPPIFRGDGTFGTPLETRHNGFIQAEGSYIDGLTIRRLRFEDFDRGLAFPNSHDTSVEGCPLISGAGAKNISILDNTRRIVQLFGGPLEGFVVSGNDVELASGAGSGGGLGMYVIGSWGFSAAAGSRSSCGRSLAGILFSDAKAARL
jgi:hypothetical protein